MDYNSELRLVYIQALKVYEIYHATQLHLLKPQSESQQYVLLT